MDHRLTPARPDLAAAHLRGTHAAARHGLAQMCRVTVPSLPLRRVPDAAAPYETELLYGEEVAIYALEHGFAWGQAVRDGYVGYLPIAGLAGAGAAPTHRVATLRSFAYPAANIKGTPLMALPFNAVVSLEKQSALHPDKMQQNSQGEDGLDAIKTHNTQGAGDARFVKTEAGFFLYAAHLTPLSQPARDPVAEAERFLGIPYLWGGKSSFGLDCSGLVENACFACGIPTLRDSDMQERSLGSSQTIPPDGAAYRRGDLLFWPGHVAIAQGNGLMIHANAHHMMVASEPIDAAIARIAATGTLLRGVRHLPISA